MDRSPSRIDLGIPPVKKNSENEKIGILQESNRVKTEFNTENNRLKSVSDRSRYSSCEKTVLGFYRSRTELIPRSRTDRRTRRSNPAVVRPPPSAIRPAPSHPILASFAPLGGQPSAVRAQSSAVRLPPSGTGLISFPSSIVSYLAPVTHSGCALGPQRCFRLRAACLRRACLTEAQKRPPWFRLVRGHEGSAE